MSEHEFENYLRLLGGLLNLSGKQRTLIAGELRDHMEERLADLTQRGLQRAQAIAVALEEFGEAAALAADLTRIGKQRRRRWIMRATMGSITAAAALVLVAMTLWPDSPGGMAPQVADAQQMDLQPLGGTPVDVGNRRRTAKEKASPASEADRNAATLGKLTQAIDVDCVDEPLADMLAQISDRLGVQVFIDRAALDDEGIATDAPVTITLEDVPADTLLDLTLGQLGLGYTVRSGILIVSTQLRLEDSIETRVYDVRDLLSATRAAPRTEAASQRDGYGGAAGSRGGGGYGGGYGRPAGRRSSGMGGYGEEGMGYGYSSPTDDPARSRAAAVVDIDALVELSNLADQLSNSLTAEASDRAATLSMARRVANVSNRMLDTTGGKLLNIITTTVQPHAWEDSGGPGSIREYRGALIVSADLRVHRELQQLIDDLRKVVKTDHRPVVVVPRADRGALGTRTRRAPGRGGVEAALDAFGAPTQPSRDLRPVPSAADREGHPMDLFEDSTDGRPTRAKARDSAGTDDVFAPAPRDNESTPAGAADDFRPVVDDAGMEDLFHESAPEGDRDD